MVALPRLGGIGADDIFVFVDTWKQSRTLRVVLNDDSQAPGRWNEGAAAHRRPSLPSSWAGASKARSRSGAGEAKEWYEADRRVRVRAPLPLRLSWTFREAGYSMLITTATTSAAFFGSAVSRIQAVNEFGVFMGIIVIANYGLVLTFFSAALMQGRHKRWRCGKQGGGKQGSDKSSSIKSS